MSAVTIGTTGLIFGTGGGIILSATETSSIDKTTIKDYRGRYAGISYVGQSKTAEYKVLMQASSVTASGPGMGGGFPFAALSGPSNYVCESVSQERTNNGWAIMTFRSSAYDIIY
jgi:hypothetical protein